MLQGKRLAVFFAVSAALVVFSAVAAAVCIAREGLGANGAAWVQAGGSIAAITSAVWLFRSEADLRRKERRTAGLEVAWAVRFALKNAQLDAHTTATECVDKHILEGEHPVRHWLLRSENARNVLRVFAERTDHIHPVLNQIASNGVLLLQQMDQDILRAAGSIERGQKPSIEAAADVARYEGNFALLVQMLDERMRGILIALDEGGGDLPVSRFDAWQVPSGYEPP